MVFKHLVAVAPGETNMRKRSLPTMQDDKMSAYIYMGNVISPPPAFPGFAQQVTHSPVHHFTIPFPHMVRPVHHFTISPFLSPIWSGQFTISPFHHFSPIWSGQFTISPFHHSFPPYGQASSPFHHFTIPFPHMVRANW